MVPRSVATTLVIRVGTGIRGDTGWMNDCNSTVIRPSDVWAYRCICSWIQSRAAPMPRTGSSWVDRVCRVPKPASLRDDRLDPARVDLPQHRAQLPIRSLRFRPRGRGGGRLGAAEQGRGDGRGRGHGKECTPVSHTGHCGPSPDYMSTSIYVT